MTYVLIQCHLVKEVSCISIKQMFIYGALTLCSCLQCKSLKLMTSLIQEIASYEDMYCSTFRQFQQMNLK